MSGFKDFSHCGYLKAFNQTSQWTQMWNYYLEAKDKVQKQKETAGKQQVSERYSTREFPRATIHMHIPHMYHSFYVSILNKLIWARNFDFGTVPWEPFIGHLIGQAIVSKWLCQLQASQKQLTIGVIRRVSDIKTTCNKQQCL